MTSTDRLLENKFILIFPRLMDTLGSPHTHHSELYKKTGDASLRKAVERGNRPH